jgi:hypothetical protein
MDQGRTTSISTMVFWLALAPATAAAIDFQTLSPVGLSKTSPSDYAMADFNGDGHQDLAVVMSGIGGGDGGVSVLLGDGSAGFSNRDFPTTAYNAWGVTAADFDGDGHQDLALTATVTPSGTASRDVHILLGDGSGAFSEHSTTQALQDAPRAVVAGDFNEDGILDLVVGTAQTTSFHAGAAGATFGAGQSLGGSSNLSGLQLYTADFNGDGHLDVGNRQAVYLGAGDGSFSRSAAFATGAKASADLNGDGVEDLVSAAGSSLQVWFGNGDGTFAFNETITVGNELAYAVATDFDADGNADVALVSAGDNSVAVLLNNGDGTFSTPATFATGLDPRLIAAADWDEDGYRDMLVPYNNQGDTPYATRLIQIPSGPSHGQLQFSAATYSVSEAGPSITITVTRTAGSLGAVSVDYATSDGSATAGSDYTFTSGTLNFGDGVTLQEFVVPILDDTDYEGDETVNLALSNASGGASLGSPTNAVLTIVENDPAPPAGSITLSSATYGVSEAGGAATINVIRSSGSFGTVSVDYATSDGSATAGVDYSATAGTLTFADGILAQSFDIPVLDDAIYEGDETVHINLSNVTGGASLGTPASAVLTIQEDDPIPPAGSLQFSAAAYQVDENAGSILISVTRSGGSFGAVTVDYTSSDGSATAGSDYTFSSGTLSFADGEVSKTFSVDILDDTQYEGDETLSLALSNTTGGASLGIPAAAVLTIKENDPTPPAGSLQFSGAAYSAAENAGSVLITVSRTGGSFGAVSVDYASSDISATAGSDYDAVNSTLNLADGQVSATFSVTLLDDSIYEGDETLQLSLSNPGGGASLGSPAIVTLTVQEDDPVPPAGNLTLSSATYTVNEAAGNALITVMRSGGSFGTVSVDYATGDGSATDGDDYTGVTGTLSFGNGVISQSFNIPLLDDTLYEGNETLDITLSNATGGASLGTPHTAQLTIEENDPPPAAGSLQFSGVSYTVNEGGANAVITVTRSGGSFGSVSVDYASADDTAAAGEDYTAVAGTLTLTDGETSKSFTVVILDDTVYEGDEQLKLHLSNPVGGAALGTVRDAFLTIKEDDPPPPEGSLQLSGMEYVFSEADGTVNITVTRSGGSSGEVMVDYATRDGTARAGEDYQPAAGTLVFADGILSRTLSLDILDDTADESAEGLDIILSNVTGGGVLGQPMSAQVVIIDNDAPASPKADKKSSSGAWDVVSLALLVTSLWVRRRKYRFILSSKPIGSCES